MTLSSFKKIHFVGIGGISMSSLAEILNSWGYTIIGSDMKSSEITEKLISIGIKVYIGQKCENIEDDVDLIVYTAAVNENNPELLEGKKKNIKTIDRAELVGLIMKNFKYPISIAGTHGKTTTTSMVTEIFLEAETNPTVSIGGILPSISGNYKIGSNDYFVVETCEYCDSFLKFNPFAAIILNIDKDHTDYFKDIEHIYSSFNKFACRIPENGFLVINNDIKDVSKVTESVKCNIITYGIDNKSMYYPENIVFNEKGCASFDVIKEGKKIYHINLSVPGKHNIYNALSAIALCDKFKISEKSILNGLEKFTGTHRRFEFKGKFNDNITVIDDYAHHPTEIKATLEAAKSNKINKLWCVFQPHTYSRTKSLLEEFSYSFDKADNIILLDIYAAREKDTGEIHSRDLLEKLKSRNKKVYYFENFESAVSFIKSECQKNDMLITMGAGDVYLLGEMLLKK